MPKIIDEKILNKAKKLKELADRGIGGEKIVAENMLKEYMDKHNINIYDITGIYPSTIRLFNKEILRFTGNTRIDLKAIIKNNNGIFNISSTSEHFAIKFKNKPMGNVSIKGKQLWVDDDGTITIE